MPDSEQTLYHRLGGYDSFAALADSLLPRLMTDDRLARFWKNRGDDGLRREKQLLIDFLCHSSGGPLLYTGRDMTTSHQGMGIEADDWTAFAGHLRDTLVEFKIPSTEQNDVVQFIESLRDEIVDK